MTTAFLVNMTIRFLRENGMIGRFKLNIIKRNICKEEIKLYDRYNGNIVMFLFEVTKKYQNMYYPLSASLVWDKTIEGCAFWGKAYRDCKEYIECLASQWN